MRERPRRRPLWLAIICHIVFRCSFRVAMHTEDGSWLMYTTDSLRRARMLHEIYREQGFH